MNAPISYLTDMDGVLIKEGELIPGAVAAMITAVTGKEPYYIGKPNPVMMRSALNNIGAHSERAVMIGDRMDTDVKAGLEAGMRTILVRSGISDDAEIERYPFRQKLTGNLPPRGNPRCEPAAALRWQTARRQRQVQKALRGSATLGHRRWWCHAASG
ncbi:Ribonucleotide monophosphatase NagD [Corynebacterium cystitidis DSM 20524]|uniref:HAD-hyrolase-like n=1 Tax=Corynebacterium cystitidis DSM 20524 TaxID=1121357 RepID=A0A1H9VNL7_9CORY|nr:Ribonucleotide monophosphatase NagD [Corynebacterium cystitidis DSM 20524]SES23265.1 HAD-hyrolase-like [Corynebacterium cystitidis DSM 20524]SNV69501.1 pyridoxal phosphate phosphatase [Corynebacterium cystitidis]